MPLNHKVLYIDESGINLYQRRTKGRAPVGQPVHREVNPRGKNVNVIIAICSEIGVVHYSVSQETLDHQKYQKFMDDLVRIAAPMFNEPVHIIHDNARPHLRTAIDGVHADQFSIRSLPTYSPFLNPVEQIHSCFKAAIGRQLTRPDVQEELQDACNSRREVGLNLGQWRSNILCRLARQAIQEEITQRKCSNWCNRVNRYIPACLAREDNMG